MDERGVRGDCVPIARCPLVGCIEARVHVAVGRGVGRIRVQIRGQRQHPDGTVVNFTVPLISRPHIRCDAVKVGAGIGTGADIAEPTVGKAAVAAYFHVPVIVEHGVGARAEYRAAKAGDQRSGRGTRGERRTDVREAPGRCGVPQVLHRGVVVQANADYGRVVAERHGAGVANIEVVPRERTIRSAVGELSKSSQMLAQLAAVEEADLIDR